MSTNPSSFPVIRGRTIRVDEQNRICLNDLHKAAGYSTNKSPSAWRDLPTTGPFQVAVLERITGKSGNFTRDEMRALIVAKGSAAGGTFAHPIMALAYAEYLSDKLAVEVKEVFLRYKAADATLADDILQRATPEANEWAGTRALGRTVRSKYTDTLKNHGAEGKDYGMCTNALYQALFDGGAKKLREQKGLPARGGNLRDKMTTPELVYVMAGETLSTERIEDEGAQGGEECRRATTKSARFIRDAIDADRRDRRRRLL
ncbi:MAG TPA: KilA-N domain-containing protein [Caulobacteraceae bacterium]